MYDYLKENIKNINEDIMVAITCFPKILKEFFSDSKEIYVFKNTNGITKKYNGEKWGGNFYITDSELDLYNSKEHDIIKKFMSL